MEKHQIAAIVTGIILLIISFIPILVISLSRYDLARAMITGKVWLSPVIGTTIASILVVLSFWFKKK